MKLNKLSTICGCSLWTAVLGGVMLAMAPSTGQAQSQWPSRAVHIIMPAGSGGSSDPLARMVATELSKELGQSFVVENKPGANGNIGAASVAAAKPDGYTLLFSWTGTLVSAVTMYGSKPFDPVRDFEPIALIASIPNVVAVTAELPVKSLDELTSYSKSNPEKLSFGSTGSGSSWHLAGELYKKMAGASLLHVPYTSPGTVVTDLVSGRLQAAFPQPIAVASLVQEGRLKALAVMADERSSSLPDTPTTKELGYPDLVASTWFALLAPKGTSKEIVDKINHALNGALKKDDFRNELLRRGYTPLGGTDTEFAAYMREEISRWDEIVKFAGAKID
ncbi:Bug family tripartite tricarboxylate transporter substrate binding protein [Parapusillimonas granuli]|uniref:Tripartite tricarboxylate transporter substrate binding protein n=1 Tax=Parapusillimonas granuli TaxID=380911 RepID=A0A853G155_9BURK|nr:tripartite tricarboxylate transporter substrate binding protein [Parapusillimonas granuli]MBB5213716.1 tripartite-type tricarboxylate transporter receptor subunit TctC [Parapusillimonas granuli]NYT48551.1 tripartite tricarboxylate transporter substrate binding protein [Parapusillimonas granuli]